MAKCYIEHDDYHNGSSVYTYQDMDAAIKDINDAEMEAEEEIRDRLIEDGEYYGGDHWTVITEKDARIRELYWQRIANAIAADEDAL